jgi:hypothetical protein
MLPRVKISKRKTSTQIDQRITKKVNRILEAISILNKHKQDIDIIINKLTTYCEADDKFYTNIMGQEIVKLSEKIKATSTIVNSVSINKFFEIDKRSIKTKVMKIIKANETNKRLSRWNIQAMADAHPEVQGWNRKYVINWYNHTENYIKDYLSLGKEEKVNDGTNTP